MNTLIEPYDGPYTTSKNRTSLSRFCDKLVMTFLQYNARQARVITEKINIDFEELYQGLYSITRRKSLKGVIKVHKENGRIFLVRLRPMEGKDA